MALIVFLLLLVASAPFTAPFTARAANTLVWNYTVIEDGMVYLTEVAGGVSYPVCAGDDPDTLLVDAFAEMACKALGFNGDGDGYYASASDAGSYPTAARHVLTSTAGVQSLAECGVSPVGTNEGSSCDSIVELDCPVSGGGGSSAPPMVFNMTFHPSEDHTPEEFSSLFKTEIVTEMEHYAIMITADRISIVSSRRLQTHGSGDPYEIQFLFTPSSVPPSHEILQEWFLTNMWRVFSVTMNLTKADVPRPTVPHPGVNTTEWEFRLTGGSQPWIGLLEIRPDPSLPWGTMCNDGLDDGQSLTYMRNLQVICRSVGYPESRPSLLHNNTIGERASMPIYVDDLNCEITDQVLEDCDFIYSRHGERLHDCTHAEDVYVHCFHEGSEPTNATNPTDAPWHQSEIVLWTAMIEADAYGDSDDEFDANFARYMADFVNVDDASRIKVVSRNMRYGSTVPSRITFRFTNVTDNADTSREELDGSLEVADPIALKVILRISNLTSNRTTSHYVPGVVPDAPFVYALSDHAHERGRVIIKPNGGPFGSVAGTICSLSQWKTHEARALCHAAENASSDVAGAIPYFQGDDLQEGPIYMSDVSCHEGNLDEIRNCSYQLKIPNMPLPEYNMNSQCTGHSTDSGVVCAKIQPPLPENQRNTMVKIYTGTLCAECDEWTLYRAINKHFPLEFRRFSMAAYTRKTDGVPGVISFFFADAPEYGVARQDYEYFFDHVSAAGKEAVFGLTSVTSEVKAPPANPETLPPEDFVNTTGWKFRLTGGDTPQSGLLEVLPKGKSVWGTLCANMFSRMSARAICETLGFPSEKAVGYPPKGDILPASVPIYMSRLDCNDEKFDTTIQNCGFDYYPEGNAPSCTHHEDVHINCNGFAPPGSSEPRSFMAITKQAAYATEGAFKDKWASFFNTTSDRVYIFDVTTRGEWKYWNFTMINNADTRIIPDGPSGFSNDGSMSDMPNMAMAPKAAAAAVPFDSIPVAPTPVPPKPAHVTGNDARRHPYVPLDFPSGDFPSGDFPSGNFPSGAGGSGTFSFSGGGFSFPSGMSIPDFSFSWDSLPFGNIDAKILIDFIAAQDAELLYYKFDIYEMWSNTTKPDGDANFDGELSVRLKSDFKGMSTRFGRVELQPGAGAMWGTACSGTAFTAAGALQLCRKLDASATQGHFIPHFNYGRDIIWTDGFDYKNGAFVFTSKSSKTQKRNQCTHMTDLGLLCGRNLLPDAEVPNQGYKVALPVEEGATPPTGDELLSKLSKATGISLDRFVKRGEALEDGTKYLNFSMSDSSTGLTKGDLDLIVQHTSSWALRHHVGTPRLAVVQFEGPPPPPGPTPSPTPGPTPSPPPGPTTPVPTSGPSTPTPPPGPTQPPETTKPTQKPAQPETTKPTQETEQPETTTTHAPTKEHYTYTVNETIDEKKLQEMLEEYGGVVTKCEEPKDGKRICDVAFASDEQAKRAAAAKLDGVYAAAPTKTGDGDSKKSLLVPIVASIVGVVVLGVIIGVVVYVMRRRARSAIDQDFVRMNMVLEDNDVDLDEGMRV